MPQAAERPAPTGAVIDVRAVRIAVVVGEGMVLAVVGDPFDHRPLDGRRAQDRERAADRRRGLERPVGEQAMEPDRDAEPTQDVGDEEGDDVGPAETIACGLADAEDQRENRDDGDDQRRRAVDPLRARHDQRVGRNAFDGHGVTLRRGR